MSAIPAIPVGAFEGPGKIFGIGDEPRFGGGTSTTKGLARAKKRRLEREAGGDKRKPTEIEKQRKRDNNFYGHTICQTLF